MKKKDIIKKKVFEKVFGFYAVFMSLFSILFTLVVSFFVSDFGFLKYFSLIYAIITLTGFLGGVFLIKEKKGGFILCLIWSIFQIPVIHLGKYIIFDFQQFIKLSFFIFINELIIGVNIVGIILLILLLKYRKYLN